MIVGKSAFVNLALAILTISSVGAQEWTRFRGPNGSGVGQAPSVPTQWAEEDFDWRTQLSGSGHSSPVVWGSRVFVTGAREDGTLFLDCIAVEDGRTLWTRQFESAAYHLHPRNSFASSTPAVDQDRVYIAFADPQHTQLVALSHDGQLIWQRDFGRWVSMHGFGASPVVYRDKLLFYNSQQADELSAGTEPGQSHCIALDCATGEDRWSTPLKATIACYSAPCIHTNAEGGEQIIGCDNGSGFFSLDPDTGRLNWSFDAFQMRTVASPLIVGDLILGSTGSGGGGNYLVGLRMGEPPVQAFAVRQSANYVPTPIAKEHLVFLFGDRGVLSCLDTRSGEVVGRARVADGFSSSPVRIDDRLFCVDEAGNVQVIGADQQLPLLASNPLGPPSRATPAIAGGRMFLRSFNHLVSIGGKPDP